MEKIIEIQTEKTELLFRALEIAKISDNPTVEHLCSDIRNSIVKAESLLEKRGILLSQKKIINQEFVKLTQQCNELADRSEKINQGLFPEPSYQSVAPTENIEVQNSANGQTLYSFVGSEVSPCPSAWTNGALETPMPRGPNFRQPFAPEETQQVYIKPLLPKEMELVPTYMKGRLTCDSVNSFVAVLNSVLKQKYSIVKLKRKEVKRKDLIQYSTWKTQEEEYNMTGQIFLTAEDLTNLGNFKMDKSADKITQVLRHTKRLRQSRVLGKVILYIVIR
uniref:SKA complex subunit 1 n=1 Tax=Graphocephala atropunctata TaxID=36148 RepID=A0A1B6LBS5_9HEMI